MANNGLVSLSGQPLLSEPNLVVIKVPKHIKLNPQIISGIGKLTRCSVLVLPMDCEIVMGKIAKYELESIHTAIHAILDSLTPPTK